MPHSSANLRPSVACLLHGYIGVGKTTLARRLEAERRFVRFTADEWMTQLFGDDPPAESFAESFGRVIELQQAMCRSVLRGGASVVIDWGLWTRDDRLRMRQLALDCGARPWLIALECDEVSARRRIQSRNDRLAGSLHISPNTYDVLRARFDPLGADEPADAILDTSRCDTTTIHLDSLLPRDSRA
jgi:hypothetical protein